MRASIPRRVQLQINLDTLQANFRQIANAVAPCSVMAVLKANAYGLGVRPIATALAKAGVARFGVAELQESLDLCDLGLPVHILGGVLPEEVPQAVANGIVMPIADLSTAALVSAAAVRQGLRATCHIKIDTGMGRLGILSADADRDVRAIAALPGLVCEGIYSHFPVAYRRGGSFTDRQIEDFLGLLARLETGGLHFNLRHMANSDAINNVPRACQAPFNLVRTGINLYGCFEMEGGRRLDLASILELRTKLVSVRDLPAGMNVGYGCTFTTPREMRVGTICAGYADGLPLALSNRGHVLIRNRPCPVLGRVSMDYTVVDLSQVPDAQRGDDVVCLGGCGPTRISVEDWAQIKGTHPYDIICAIGSRVARRYLGGERS